jgi:hypothetical protein
MQEQEPAKFFPCSLLGLPRELRDLILRRLLLCAPFIGVTSRTSGLHPQILQVNKQLYVEGLGVLYGENYFRMKISERYGGDHADFVKCNHFAEDIRYQLPRYKFIQHYDIYVEIQNEENLWAVRSTVQKVASVLSDVPRLKHLRITLGGDEESYDSQPLGEEVYACSHVLEPFTLLRGVHCVDVHAGLHPYYARYLKNIMEGRSPLDHLPKMYDALEYLAGPFDGFEDDLSIACSAMYDYDIQGFKEVRAELAQKFVERAKHALDHLLDHDADYDGRQEWIIEQRRKSKRGRS